MIAEDEEGDGFSSPAQHIKAFSHVHSGGDGQEQEGQSDGYLERLKASQAPCGCFHDSVEKEKVLFYNELFQLGEIRELMPEPSNRPGGPRGFCVSPVCLHHPVGCFCLLLF